jgi:D-alanyl-D-alanine carboxypeptidase
MALRGVDRPAGRSWLSRIGAVAAVAAIASMTLLATLNPAEAKRRKRGGGYNPPYASLVLDVKSGRTLHAVNADALRHPASITKVMTLYLLFEQIERGRFRMDSPLKVSSNAAAKAPSKLGLEAGESIDVEDAIMALITKSANDAATVIAENVSGTEEAFAAAMTRKARSLGMASTVFRNPSGLPDPEQVTTARDLSLLARAIQERFPKYYGLFSARSFHYAGATYRNHNKLLGRIQGVDGIKTGYTRASGFNLMTSAKADNRHIVAIVLGGRSGRIRDGIMSDLVVANLPRATTGPRTTSLIAEAPAQEERARPAVVSTVAYPEAAPRPSAPVAAAAPTTTPQRVATRLAPINVAAVQPVAAGTTTPPALRWAANAAPRPRADVPAAQAAPQPVAAPRAANANNAPAAPANGLRPPANVQFTSSIAKTEPAKAEAPKAEVARAEAPKRGEGWVIQLGATDDESKARSILNSAKSRSPDMLADASAFTEKVQRGSTTLFRARFAGFDDSGDAEKACSSLKRSGFACFATRG